MNGEIRLVPPVFWRRDIRGPLFASLLHGGLLGLMVAGLQASPPKAPPMTVSSLVVELVPLAEPTPQPAPAVLPAAPPEPVAAPAKPAPPKEVAAPKPKSPVPRPAAKPQASDLPAPSAESAASSSPALPSSGPAAGAGAAPEATASPFVPPRSDVAGLDNPRPPYPTLARRRGWEGLVVLMVLVDEMGAAQSVALHQSSGHDILDQSALNTVKAWRFVPARQGGHTVPASVQVPIRFTLDGKA